MFTGCQHGYGCQCYRRRSIGAGVVDHLGAGMTGGMGLAFKILFFVGFGLVVLAAIVVYRILRWGVWWVRYDPRVALPVLGAAAVTVLLTWAARP